MNRGRASGFFGMGVVLAPAIGPSIGGLLVDAFGWRSIFFMVVPFCVVSLWLARRYVPVTAPGGSAASADGGGLDWRGLLLASVGTLCLLNGLVQSQTGSAVWAGVLLGAASVCAGGFVVWQRHMLARVRRDPQVHAQPLMNLTLFADRRFAMGSLVAIIYGTALFGSTYLLPVYLQMGLGLSASFVGAILLPAGLLLAVTIALVGRLADRQPAYRLVSIGLALLALSFALMLTLGGPGTPWAVPMLVAWTVLGRVGLGFILPSLNLGAMRSLPQSDIPQGASVINFLRMLGGAAGVSVCGIVLEWRLRAHGASLTAAGDAKARLAAFDDTFAMLAALCALALLAAWRMRDAPPGR
jgi:predicted MFS family arabinose efflux permease